MRMNRFWIALGFTLCACSHVTLSQDDLRRVHKPAFLARMDESGNPHADVFRSDAVFRAKLTRMDAPEADRRLSAKVLQAVNRFEVGERLRAGTIAQLPAEPPWSNAASSASVASALESFLVQNVPAHEPDYQLLAPLGVDAVVEFVVDDCGMHSANGKAGAFARGYGRMFFLNGGGEIWHKGFNVDQVRQGTANLDPFVVSKDPSTLRQAMRTLLDAVSVDFARALQSDRGLVIHSSQPAPLPLDGNELESPRDDTNKTGREPPADPSHP